jgi:hypothetical protein
MPSSSARLARTAFKSPPTNMTTTPPLTAVCALCGRAPAILNSHVISKFLGKWAKATSSSPRFRRAENPNRPEQDLHKIPLLCDDCEQKIGAWEKSFNDSLFAGWCDKVEASDVQHLPDDIALPNEPWWVKLAVSYAWRAAHLARFLNDPGRPWKSEEAAALAEWNAYLDQDTAPARTQSWVLQAKAIDRVLRSNEVHGNRFYSLRVFDVRTAVFASNLGSVFATYAKVPGFAFITTHGQKPDATGMTQITGALLCASMSELKSLLESMRPDQLDEMKERGRDDAASASPSFAVRCLLEDEKERAAMKPKG